MSSDLPAAPSLLPPAPPEPPPARLLHPLLWGPVLARPIRDLSAALERMAADGDAGSMFDASHAKLMALRAAYAAVPNFQVFWLSDAVQQGKAIPLAYLLPSAAYGVAVIAAAMVLATALFQRREVG